MDSLAFGAPILLRGFSSNKREPIIEINLEEVLQGLNMNQLEFVDLCILCGCDYSPTIEGVGFTTALKLIRELNSIEEILRFVEEKQKYKVPEFFPYPEARDLFLQPDVDTDVTIHWETPDPTSVYNFLVRQKGFNQSRVESGLQRLTKITSRPS
jgi:flap endonuclease-1